MGRKLVVTLLGLAVVVLALDAGGVLPLGILGGDDGSAASGGGDLLGAEGDAGDAAGLKGLGAKGEEKKTEDDGGVADLMGPVVKSEVRGSTPGGAVVRGRVVQREGGVPLRGMSVSLGRFDSILSYLRAKVNGRYDVLVADTDAEGRFAFLDVTPADAYIVRVHEPGYAVASSDELDLRGRETVDVGDLALDAGATATGRVLDHTGKPAAGVRVAATWMINNPLGIILTDPDTAPMLQMEGTTDAEGRYTLEHLEPTDTTLFFVAPSGASQIVRKLAFDDGARTAAVPDVTLPGPRHVAGSVLWADGTPVTEARVFAAGVMGGAVRPTDVAADGSWRLEWLPEGERTNLGVLVPGMPVHMETRVAIGREDVRIEFPVPGRLDGVAVEARSGDPIGRFRIHLDPTKPPDDWTLRFVAGQVRRGLGATPFVSDAGRFSFPRVAPGSYKLTLHADGYPAATVTDIVVTAKETTTIRVEVADGHVARGTVRRSQGEVVTGARLFVIHGGVKEGAQGPQLSGYIADREPDAVTRGDGSFALPPQTPGRYDVIAAHKDALPGVLRGIDLRAGDAADIEIRLPPAGTVRGRILDESARPAKNETVYVLYRNGIVRTERAGDDGRFEFTGMPVGRCLVRWLSLRDVGTYARFFRGDSAEDKEKAYDDLRLAGTEHEVTDGGVAEVSLRLPQRTKVTGRMRIDGEVPKGTDVFYVTVEGGGHWVRVELDEEGRFDTRLEPGKYIAYYPATRNSWVGLEIEIPDTPTHRLDLGE